MITVGLAVLWLVLLAAELEAQGDAHWALLIATWIVAGYAGWLFGGWFKGRR